MRSRDRPAGHATSLPSKLLRQLLLLQQLRHQMLSTRPPPQICCCLDHEVAVVQPHDGRVLNVVRVRQRLGRPLQSGFLM